MRPECIRHAAPYHPLGTDFSTFSANARSDWIFVLAEVKSVVMHYLTASSYSLVPNWNGRVVRVAERVLAEALYVTARLSIDVRFAIVVETLGRKKLRFACSARPHGSSLCRSWVGDIASAPARSVVAQMRWICRRF